MSRTSLALREPLVLGAPAPVLAGGGAVLALVAALVETTLGSAQVVSWPIELAALAALLGAGVVVVLRASPFRAPFRAWAHAVVLALVLLGFTLDEVAQHGRNTVVHDDWGLAVVPVFLLVLAVLRPPLEVLAGGVVAVAVVVAVVLALPPSSLLPLPLVARIAVAVTPILPPALAATALARTTLERLGRQPATDAPAAPEPLAAAALSVRQDTIARLEAEAIPLLTAVTTSGAVTAEQADRARAIAAGLRSALVAALARGWLAEIGVDVDDPDRYTERMTPPQRNALRTTIASLPLADFDHPGTAVVTGQDRQAVLELVLPLSAPPRRSRVAPLVPVLRTVFPRADILLQEGRVLVQVDVVVPR